MASIFDSLKGLVTPDLISQAASSLGEDKSSVTKAITAAVPSLLGSLLAKGNDSGVESALKKAGSSGILSNLGSIFSGSSDEKTSGLGSTILNSILGDKLGGVASLISTVSGISGKSSNSLLSMLGPVVGGFLGNKMSTDGLNLSGLLGLLNTEKGSFLSAIPSGLTSVLGISSLASLGSSLTSKAKDIAGDAASTAGNAAISASNGLGKWLKWLIPLLILLGVIFFAWKSCGKAKDAATSAIQATEIVAATAVDNVVEKVRSLADFSLPDGTKLKGYTGGIESQMLDFLKSDEYKNATPDALKEKWFNFDNINFEFGSATTLTAESAQQVDNVVAILKYYKGAKVKVGAYTDKKGDAAVNLKLSQERANTIKKVLTEKGVGAQIVGAEGYGSQFAKVDVTASDDERAIDRKIAIRFEK